MSTKLVFTVSHQGETEYKVCGGEYDGRTIRVYYAKKDYYVDLMRYMRTPLERNMMEQVSSLAGTVSFVGGQEVPGEILELARKRQRCALRLSPDIAAPTLMAAKLAQDGTWVIYEPSEQVATPRNPGSVLHPVFAAARDAAAQRRGVVSKV